MFIIRFSNFYIQILFTISYKFLINESGPVTRALEVELRSSNLYLCVIFVLSLIQKLKNVKQFGSTERTPITNILVIFRVF